MAKCEFACRGRNGLFFCKVLKEQGQEYYSCGHQRYCPKEGRCIFTETAGKCTVRERKNAGGQ